MNLQFIRRNFLKKVSTLAKQVLKAQIQGAYTVILHHIQIILFVDLIFWEFSNSHEI